VIKRWKKIKTAETKKDEKTFNLNPASVEFAGDTRQQAHSCSHLPQVLANVVDPVKSALPKGKQS